MSHTATTRSLSFLRWNLDPLAAALWLQASQKTFQPLGIRVSWIEVEPHWEPRDLSESIESRRLRESTNECRPVAFIVGVDRTNLISTVNKARSLREFCNCLSIETEASTECIRERVFLIAWFPHADRQSMVILRELGFDLVLHNPASLRTALTKIGQITS
jgi:hypothetical protein